MPILVQFSESEPTTATDPLEFGPFEHVDLAGDALVVGAPGGGIPLARRAPAGGWVVIGQEGRVFGHLRLAPRTRREDDLLQDLLARVDAWREAMRDVEMPF